MVGVYLNTFVYSSISPKIQFFYCLSMEDTEEKSLKFWFADHWEMHFSWVFLGILEFDVFKYLNQRVRIVSE